MTNKLYEVEKYFQEVNKVLKGNSTNEYKLLAVLNFFEYTLQEKNQNTFTSYYLELALPFIYLIRHKSFNHFSSEDFSLIKSILNILSSNIFLKDFLNDFVEIEVLVSEELTMIFKESIHRLSANSLSIVLIEENGDHFFKKIEHGNILKLNLSSSLRGKSENIDKVEFKNLINPEEKEIVEHLHFVVAKAKSECYEKKIKSQYYNFTYYFDKLDYIYSGTSLGIGAICLAYNSILINEFQKNYYKFREDCVFSGEIDEKGNLTRLGKDSLRIKLKTVFFSEYNKFIIPEDNILEAKEELEKLNNLHPERILELIPVSNYESIFSNLAIVERFDLKFRQKLKANYSRFQKIVNIVLSLFILFVSVYLFYNFILPHLDKNPVRGSYHNGRYSAFNQKDIEVWNYIVPGVTYVNEHESPGFLNILIAVKDIDNDGKNEIVYSNNFEISNRIDCDMLICCNSDGNIKWKFKIPEKNFYYFWENEKMKGNWVFERVYIDDVNNDGFMEIIGEAKYKDYFPNRIVILNYKGELISDYWHSGYIYEISSFDIDGDGKKEIVVVGVNNYPEYRCGCMVVLDPEFASGVSVNTDPFGMGEKSIEKYYVLFPYTLMTKFNVSNFNEAHNIIKGFKDAKICVWDGESKNKVAETPFLLYEFDKNMNVTNIGTSNQFLKEYDNLVSDGKINRLPDMVQYLDSLITKVRWWNGDEFENKPVMNKYYIQAKNSKMLLTK
jgi:hypothetical protein